MRSHSPPLRSASRRVTLATSGTQEGEGQEWGLDSAMPLARQECPVIEEDTDPTPNPSPTREGRGGAPLTNK